MAINREELLSIRKSGVLAIGEWSDRPDDELLIGSLSPQDRLSLQDETKSGGWELGSRSWLAALAVRVVLTQDRARMFADTDRARVEGLPILLLAAIAEKAGELEGLAKKNVSSGGPSPGVAAAPTPTGSPQDSPTSSS